MKRFDLCIIKESLRNDLIGAYAIILDVFKDYYHVEIWNFDLFEGAIIDSLPKNKLRIANKKEQEEYQIKFKEYCIKRS